MTYEKPKCKFIDCEKDGEVERKFVSTGEETRYHWYCFRDDWIGRAAEESGKSVK